MPQWRLLQRASQVPFLKSAWPPHNPHLKLSSCPRSWRQTLALLPQACFLSFLLEFGEFSYLFPGSLWVVSDELSAILKFTGRYSLTAEELVPSLIPTAGWEIPARKRRNRAGPCLLASIPQWSCQARTEDARLCDPLKFVLPGWLLTVNWQRNNLPLEPRGAN